MKKTVYFCLIILLLMVAACVPSGQENAEVFTPTKTLVVEETTFPVIQTEVSIQVLQNMTYLSPNSGMPVQMADGVYVDGRMMGTMLPEIAFGDINGDETDDAAVLLAESGGGTATFVFLVALISHDEQFEQVGSVLIDDRPVIESLLIEDGNIKVEALIHGINDPLVSPTFKVNQSYALLENSLVLMNQTSIMRGGTQRIIVIDSPQSGSEVSGFVRIAGSMPVAPFENNLQLRILDSTGMEHYISGLMVTSADVGGPAVFDTKFSLPDMPGGKWMKLELADISMADGSVICMDSVLLEIK